MKTEILHGDASRFRGLTFPRFGLLLADVRFPLVARGLSEDGHPIGLGLTRVKDRQAQLLSLAIAPQARRAGWGTKLLRLLEEASHGCAEMMWAEYTSTLPQAAAFEATLRHVQWQPPAVRQVRFAGPIGPALTKMKNWPGMIDRRDRRSGITLEPWNLTAADDPALEQLTGEPEFAAGLSPARNAAQTDPSLSVAIRRNGVLIGWVLIERKPDPSGHGMVLNCPAAYITRSLWRTGLLVRAYVRSLVQAQRIYGDDALATFYAALPRLQALARIRSAGIATAIEVLQVTKRL